MTVLVTLRFVENGQDREYDAELIRVPCVGEFISIGSLRNMQRFEVEKVWHSHLDDTSRADLFCRKLPEARERSDEERAAENQKIAEFRARQARGNA